MSKNDIYEISGRIKNILARKDVSLSPAGNILVNTYALMLKDLYDFSEKLPEMYKRELVRLLLSKEGLPEYVIRLTTPEENSWMSLYDEVMKNRPEFSSNQQALATFEKQYTKLTVKHGLTGDDFWYEAESSSDLTADHKEIMRLARLIQMTKYLLNKHG